MKYYKHICHLCGKIYECQCYYSDYMNSNCIHCLLKYNKDEIINNIDYYKIHFNLTEEELIELIALLL